LRRRRRKCRTSPFISIKPVPRHLTPRRGVYIFRCSAHARVHTRVAVCVLCVSHLVVSRAAFVFIRAPVRTTGKNGAANGWKNVRGMLVFAITGKRDKSRERERIGRISLISRQRSSFIRLRASFHALLLLRVLFPKSASADADAFAPLLALSIFLFISNA